MIKVERGRTQMKTQANGTFEGFFIVDNDKKAALPRSDVNHE